MFSFFKIFLVKAFKKESKKERGTGKGFIYKDLWESKLEETLTQQDYDKASSLLDKIKDTIALTIKIYQEFEELVKHEKWTRIIIDDFLPVSNNWLDDNIQGRHEYIGRLWYFERSEDAMLFALRWA